MHVVSDSLCSTISLVNVLSTRKNWSGNSLSTLKLLFLRSTLIEQVYLVICFVFPYAKELECTAASYPTSLLKQIIEEVLRRFQTIGVQLVENIGAFESFSGGYIL